MPAAYQRHRHIDGDCYIQLDPDGSFQITAKDERYFAVVLRDGASANGYWNGSPDSTHAQTPLGRLKREGACWMNTSAQVRAREQ